MKKVFEVPVIYFIIILFVIVILPVKIFAYDSSDENKDEIMRKQLEEERRIWIEIRTLSKSCKIREAINRASEAKSPNSRDNFFHTIASIAVDNCHDFREAIRIREIIMNPQHKEHLARYIPLSVAHYESKNVFITLVEYMKIVIITEFLGVPIDSLIIGEFYEGDQVFGVYKTLKKLGHLKKIEFDEEENENMGNVIQSDAIIIELLVRQFANMVYKMGATVYISRGMIDDNAKIVQLIDTDSPDYKGSIINGVISIMNELNAPEKRDPYLKYFGYEKKGQLKEKIDYAGAARFAVQYDSLQDRYNPTIILFYDDEGEENFLTLVFPSQDSGRDYPPEYCD